MPARITPAHRTPATRPPPRPNITGVLTKICGIALLVASVGIASCQALWVEAPGYSYLFPTEQRD